MSEENLNNLEGFEGVKGAEGLADMNGMGMMNPETMQTVEMINNISNGVSIVFYLLSAWGLYMLAKKMNLKRAWMSWVPLLQYYPLAQAGSKSLLKNLVYPLLGLLASFAIMGILGALMGSIGGIIGVVLVIVATIYFLMKYIEVLSGISKNTGRGGWTTAGLFFVSFIMLPIVGYKYKGGPLAEKNTEKGEDSQETLVSEKKEEL